MDPAVAACQNSAVFGNDLPFAISGKIVTFPRPQIQYGIIRSMQDR
jgi:hypothetical protein